MSRFTDQPDGIKTVNYEGEVAYKTSPEFDLYSLVCTSTFNDKFYTSNKSELQRLRDLLPKVYDDKFICQLAVYAREQMHLRTIPLVLLVEALKQNRYIPHFVITRVIQRADEIAEILGYYALANDREGIKKLSGLSNQLKKGVANAFNKFDEYQFGKYNRDTVPSLRDAMFLTHPKPKRGNKKLFQSIAEDTLPIPYTWETQLSERGNTAEVWDELIASKKLGYMATLRNLRNIMQAEAKQLPAALGFIANPEAVAKSKQLPFRFWSAYRMIKEAGANFHAGAVLAALEQAMKHSAVNIPIMDGDKVLVACDSSGSMTQKLSDRSSVMLADIGIVMGSMMQYRNPANIFGLFSDDWTPVTVPAGNILHNVESLRSKCRYGSTNGYLVLDWLIRKAVQPDKLFFFTDLQLWDSYSYGHDSQSFQNLWFKYKQIVPHAKMYLFDLDGYGDSPVDLRQKDVYQIAGWSDKVFQVLYNLDNGMDALKAIKEIRL